MRGKRAFGAVVAACRPQRLRPQSGPYWDALMRIRVSRRLEASVFVRDLTFELVSERVHV